jgi:hypothetical protein
MLVAAGEESDITTGNTAECRRGQQGCSAAVFSCVAEARGMCIVAIASDRHVGPAHANSDTNTIAAMYFFAMTNQFWQYCAQGGCDFRHRGW